MHELLNSYCSVHLHVTRDKTVSVNTTSSCVTMVLVVLMMTMVTLLPATQGLPSPGCSQPLPDTPPPGNHSRFNVSVADQFQGAVTRTYYLHLPAAYSPDNSEAVALVLDYPGYGVNSNWEMESKPWRGIADTAGAATNSWAEHHEISLTHDASTPQGLSTWRWRG